MKANETPAFLARLHVHDNRQVDQVTASHWHELLAPYTLAECLEALRTHASTSTDYLMPAHIIRNVKAARNNASLRDELPQVENPAPMPDNFAAMTAAYNDPVAWAREVAKYNRQLIEAGLPPLFETQKSWVA